MNCCSLAGSNKVTAMARLLTPGRRILRVPHVRATNRAAVLQLLRRLKSVSRAEIARRTGLSEAAVSRIVAELMAEDLIAERGGAEATGGRPGIRLQLNESRFRTVGVDIQNWETRVSLGTGTGRVLETVRFRTPSNPNKTLRTIAEQVEALTANLASGQEVAIGISTRGIVNSETGVMELGSHPAWVRVAMKDSLTERLRRPVFVENNVRAAAVAEYQYGSLEIQGTRCLLLVKVDEGVGMGIVLDGKLYHGPRMAAGEFGQMVIAYAPGPERHDRPGCVEMLASDTATCARYRHLTGGRCRSGAGSVTDQVRRVCQLAMEGDPAAREAVTETATYLGVGIANAVWALDAEAVVINGSLTEAWPLVSTAIRDQFPTGRQFLNFRSLLLRPSSLGGEASILGALALPFLNVFSSEDLTAGEPSVLDRERITALETRRLNHV